MLSHFRSVWLFVPLWTAALQAPQSMGFSRQEYCCHALLQGIFPTQWLNPRLLRLLHYMRILYLFHIIWKPLKLVVIIGFFFFYNQSLLIIIQYPLFVIEFTRFTTIHTNIIWWALLFVPLSFRDQFLLIQGYLLVFLPEKVNYCEQETAFFFFFWKIT